MWSPLGTPGFRCRSGVVADSPPKMALFPQVRGHILSYQLVNA